ncbi:MAG: cysteine synthase family protein [Chloroflexi bacterium]|nr:cysteine synthase family protein [Chloroflexota bacterium]
MNILDQIGKTPLLKLQKVIENPDVVIYVKCEYLNPGGSIKDRMALRMIEEAEKAGKLKPGDTILDQSTGNTGPALAFVGAVKGYDVRLFLPARLGSSYNPADRVRIAELFGCKVETVDLSEAVDNIEGLTKTEKAAAFVAARMKACYDLEQKDPHVWWANQLCNFDNVLAHRDTTGVEIVEQLEGKVDAWVASVGTGGTLLGVAETLREHNPSVNVIGVLPSDDPRIDWVRSGAIHKFLEQHGMPHLKFIIETILEKGLLDQTIVVDNEDAREMAGRLCREEGLFCGMSSGANVFAAVQTARKMSKGSKIVTVLVDSRDRYFAEYPDEHYVV